MTSVSVIMPTYNSIRTIEACLDSVDKQDYPKENIEVIAADGGSSDGTIGILHKYDAIIIHEQTGSPEAAKALALNKAKGDLILFLPSDNVLPHDKWLKKFVALLNESPDCVAVYPRTYGWRKHDAGLTRYFALLGANDPVAWFLGKADRQSVGEIKKTGKVIFNQHTMPTLGDNGFLIKKSYLESVTDPKHFYHIDVCFDLVGKGFNKFLIADDTIIHDTGDTLLKFLYKRYRYMKNLYLQEKENRRYHVYNPSSDTLRLITFCLYSITFIGPLFHAIKGYFHKPDYAWFYHPLMCIGILMVYGWAIIEDKVKS